MIPFVQFMRPDGHMKQVTIERPPEIESAANELIEAGCRFEVEELSTGEVHLSCELDDTSLAGKVCQNGPDVLSAVDYVVMEALNQYRIATPAEPTR